MDPINTNSPGARFNLDKAADQALKNKLITPNQFEALTRPVTKPGDMAKDLEIGRAVLERAQRNPKGTQLETARALFAAAEALVVSAGDLKQPQSADEASFQQQAVLTALKLESEHIK